MAPNVKITKGQGMRIKGIRLIRLVTGDCLSDCKERLLNEEPFYVPSPWLFKNEMDKLGYHVEILEHRI